MGEQLELFERSEIDIMRGELRELEKNVGNIRRGMFARHDELEKQNIALREELDRQKEAVRVLRDLIGENDTLRFVSPFASCLSAMKMQEHNFSRLQN